MKIKPLNDQVIVLDEPAQKKTIGGVLLPMNLRVSTRATVIAVGPGKVLGNGKRREMGVEVGDRVLVSRGGIPIEQEGFKGNSRLLDIQDIIAVWR